MLFFFCILTTLHMYSMERLRKGVVQDKGFGIYRSMLECRSDKAI